jgi:hypothetical protein
MVRRRESPAMPGFLIADISMLSAIFAGAGDAV